MDLSKSREFFSPDDLKGRIHIIGCGSVGSTVAELLARYGITKFTLYDFDKVEAHNLANQMFVEKDIGKLKTEAVAAHLTEVNHEVQCKLFNEGWNGQKLSGWVFLCVDSIALRKKIAESCVGNTSVLGMFDFRTRLLDAQHYAADWQDETSRQTFLNSMEFTDAEAKEATPVSACNVELSVAPTVRMICCAGVANFTNFAKGDALKSCILIDAFKFIMVDM